MAALEAAVAANWTAVKPAQGGAGIWESDVIERMDFDRIHAPGGQMRGAYAVLEYGEGLPAEGSPITAKIYSVETTLHLFTPIGIAGAGQIALRTQLEAMETYLLATGLGNSYSVQAVTAFTLPPRHPANELFLQGNLPWVAGSVTARCWVGES
jgi:hypothetical protein